MDRDELKPNPAEEENAMSADKLKSMQILMVEDAEINALILSKYLDKMDVQYKWAVHGRMALDMLAQEDYDIVLLDLQMPVMDGYDTALAIRELPDQRKRNIPIIVMTSSIMEEDKRRAFACGVNDYLEKPINIEILKDKLIRYCGNA